MAEQTVASSVFKARCLRILDDVARTGVAVVVTKRGRPVARLVPLGPEEEPSLRGSVAFASADDLLDPIDASWEAEASR